MTAPTREEITELLELEAIAGEMEAREQPSTIRRGNLTHVDEEDGA